MSLQCTGPCGRVGISLDGVTSAARAAWRRQQRCPMCAAGSVDFHTNVPTVCVADAAADVVGDVAVVVYRRGRPESREERALRALKETHPTTFAAIMEQKAVNRRIHSALVSGRFMLKNSRMDTGASAVVDSAAAGGADGSDGGSGNEESAEEDEAPAIPVQPDDDEDGGDDGGGAAAAQDDLPEEIGVIREEEPVGMLEENDEDADADADANADADELPPPRQVTKRRRKSGAGGAEGGAEGAARERTFECAACGVLHTEPLRGAVERICRRCKSFILAHV